MGDVDSAWFSDGEPIAGMTLRIHSKISDLFHSAEVMSSSSSGKTLGTSGDARPMDEPQTSAKKRVLFFDQIKALMIALVIATHVPFAFWGGWMGVRIPMEGISDPLFGAFYGWFMGICNSFYMYMLFRHV